MDRRALIAHHNTRNKKVFVLANVIFVEQGLAAVVAVILFQILHDGIGAVLDFLPVFLARVL